MSSIIRGMSERTSDDLLIAGTNTSAGKNFLMCGLLRAAKNRGTPVKPFKPLEIDLADGSETVLSPGMHQKAWSARVPLVGSMCPFWVVYHAGVPNLHQCGEHKGCITLDGRATDSAFVGEVIGTAVQDLKSDGAHLIVEAPGAFSESYKSPQVAAVLSAIDPDIILVGDFIRGGGLAFLIGTIELLPPGVKKRIVGIVLNHIDEAEGTDYPKLCSQQLEQRFGIPIIGMLPTYREGYHMISEENKVMPDHTFDLQVDQLAIELESRLHQSVMASLELSPSASFQVTGSEFTSLQGA